MKILIYSGKLRIFANGKPFKRNFPNSHSYSQKFSRVYRLALFCACPYRNSPGYFAQEAIQPGYCKMFSCLKKRVLSLI